ncbi:YlmC/YmxH family sporulation protein [Clostridium isatidis]|uniref:Sporulation protein, YlmC/YmxH family n=1 Tax=Clostridium isatidis TaxID=182773 RepID=A0A343JBT5_9CLOT|nr:YlmC/YmxH family sporulation protein [Clostridium isatidis]ASW42993.1 sporulation protein, YlmC/YmxH family [Clostridium isatidis]NLZ34594.1 YlmC/YmxH family sporulation protein [Clostridiales bacterium]
MGFFDNFKLEENVSTEEKENELFLHSLNALRTMEVIDIKTGTKLGYIKDIVVDIENSKVVSILLPGLQKGWFSKEEDIEIPWEKVIKAGMEIILIDSSEVENLNFNI